MEEKDLKKRIDEQSEEIKIPVTLEPECVMEQLEERAKKRKLTYYKKIMAAAACCAVVAGIGMAGAAGLFDHGGNNSGDAPQASSDSAKVTAIASAKDYDEVYAYIEAENQRRDQNAKAAGQSVGTMEAKQESATGSQDGAVSYSESNAAYSDTNIREAGVGEGDIVKTDGERLYVLNNHRIDIVDITQEKMEPVSEIDLSSEDYVSEIFVKNDCLIVVYFQSEYQETGTDSEVRGGMYREYTVAETFDISNPEKPKSIGKISQSGNYDTMRVVGDYVYLFSNYYPELGVARKDVEAYVPMVQGDMLESRDILLPSLKAASQYTVITSFSLQNPEEKIDSKAVFGTAEMCYVSGENLYICESDYGDAENDSDVNQTWIRKMSYKDGILKAVGQVKVDGVLNDSFSIDEYEGNLRLVTTISHKGNDGVLPITLFGSKDEETREEPEKDSNVLYILDEKLGELSRIEGLAEEEQIYSARFMGETGYFVTYRQIDPLFSVDLSDPKNPEVLGELKIPGFSEYLHPYGEGLLLGIGMDVDKTGTTTNGVKLSMFDISNPEDVQEVQKYVIEDTYSTDVAYNYKAAFIDVEKNLIGFAAYGEEVIYYIFTYDKDGFTCAFERRLIGLSSNVRAFYVGDILYLVAGNTVESYQLDTFEKIDDIVL